MNSNGNLKGRYESKVIGECVYLIDNTLNPETYFTKYAMLLKILSGQSEVQNNGKIQGENSLTAQLQETAAAREENTEKFLQRSYTKACADMNKLKTKRGKVKRIDQYLKSIEIYAEEMTPGNRRKFVEIRQSLQEMSSQW